MPEFGHTGYVGAGFAIDAWGAGPFLIEAGGREWRFEDSDRFGPALIKKNGDLMPHPYPPERSPFWRAHKAWVEQGRQVEEDRKTCIYEPLQPTIVKRGNGRNALIVRFGDPGGGYEEIK